MTRISTHQPSRFSTDHDTPPASDRAAKQRTPSARDLAGRTFAPAPGYDDDLLAFVENDARKSLGGATYFSIDPKIAHRELPGVRERSAGGTHVVRSSKKDGCITVRGSTYDLRTQHGIHELTRMLHLREGIPMEQAKKIGIAIEGTVPSGRDEVAGLALAWAKGERGERIDASLVIGGGTNFGPANAPAKKLMLWCNIQELAEAMPRAAAQIEHLEIHGDAAIHKQIKDGDRENEWYRAFPKLRSIETYSVGEHRRALRVG